MKYRIQGKTSPAIVYVLLISCCIVCVHQRMTGDVVSQATQSNKQEASHQAKETYMTTTSEGVALHARAPVEYIAGCKMPFELTIENKGDKPISLLVGDTFGNLTVTVKRQDIEPKTNHPRMVPAEYTRWGKRLAPDALMPPSHRQQLSLPPTKSVNYHLNLARCFDLSTTGKYAVDIRIDVYVPSMKKNVAVRINEFYFSVFSPKQESTDRVFVENNLGVLLKGYYRKQYRLGESVNVLLSAINNEKKPVHYLSGPLQSFHIRLEQNGKEVPATRYGKWHLRPVHLREDVAKYYVQAIPPDKSLDVNLDLSRLYDLTLPGKYKATVSWYRNDGKPAGNDKNEELKLGSFEFEVKE